MEPCGCFLCQGPVWNRWKSWTSLKPSFFFFSSLHFFHVTSGTLWEIFCGCSKQFIIQQCKLYTGTEWCSLWWVMHPFQCSTSVMQLTCLWGCLRRCTARQFEFWSFECLVVFYILGCFHLYTKDMTGSKVHCCSDDKRAFRALLSLNISMYSIITLILDFRLYYPKGKSFFIALYLSDRQSIWQTISKKQYIQQHIVKNTHYQTALTKPHSGLFSQAYD